MFTFEDHISWSPHLYFVFVFANCWFPVFCGSLFAFFSFCCLSFYNLQLLIAPFASSVFHCSLSLPLWYLRRFLSIVVGFTTTYAVSSYHHWCFEFESRSGRSVQHYVIKFVSDLRQVGSFLRVHRFLPPIKLTATL
jgi:hypothetical protein